MAAIIFREAEIVRSSYKKNVERNGYGLERGITVDVDEDRRVWTRSRADEVT